jgi:hypothetical protein
MRSLISAVALTALTAVAVPALPATAAKKKPKPPSTATIKRLLKRDYCAPTAQKSVKVTFNTIKRAKPRVGDSYTDGTPAGKKTWVFPVKAKYFCDYQYKDPSVTPGYHASDRRISSTYSFFRDEFGTWVEKNHGGTDQTVPGNN